MNWLTQPGAIGIVVVVALAAWPLVRWAGERLGDSGRWLDGAWQALWVGALAMLAAAVVFGMLSPAPSCDYACKVMRATHGQPFGGPAGEARGQ